MRQFICAAVMVAVFGSSVGAQPIPTVPLQPPRVPATPQMPQPQPLPPDPPPPAAYQPNVVVPPGVQPGPAIPFHKSTGVVVGAYGLYPYDTGNWLLGGTDGLTRQSGSFTMVFPGTFAGVPAARKHSLFRK
jgi:hypothetical protein